MEEMVLWAIKWKSASQGYLADGRDCEYKDSGTETGQCEEPGETAGALRRITAPGWGEERAEGGAGPARFSGVEGCEGE